MQTFGMLGFLKMEGNMCGLGTKGGYCKGETGL